ncbi:MMPL family transporter [Pseudolysinimonas yzui]|uniref:Membrane protein n=1 Tax=Pseudolysinimonas yzui TaxID=2708254 RepID=A0A8J3GMJ5_9MICO|nr:MMPL family transporter [Pseudolysinimonas yzui]GHF04196.1 membrane protein [Pseudolysinimonas yzui]
MARLLARLGRFSSRRPWLVIIGWVLALAAAGGAFLLTGGQLASGFSIPNTPTQQVTDKLSAELDGVGGAVGTVVFQTDDGTAFTAEQQSEISDVIASIGDLDGVATAVDPFVTAQERAGAAQQLADGAAQLEQAFAQLEQAGMEPTTELLAQRQQVDLATSLLDNAAEIRTVSTDGATAVAAVIFDDTATDLAAEVKTSVATELDDAGIDGVTIEYSSEIANSLEGLIGVGEVVGLLAAALVLVIMLGALIPASLPLVSSILGVGVGVAGSLAFSGVVEMASVTPVLGVMLGLAVGIDYTLFIVNRHRRQLRDGADVRESIALANGTAGNAVVFAGATVVIALLALNVTGIPFLGVMGTVAAACVLIAVLVAVTFTPALLSLVGMRVLSKRARAKIGHPDHVATAPKAMPTWRAIVAVVTAVGILLVAAIPALSLRLGLPDGSSEPEDSTQYRAYSIVAEEFGAGTNGTLVVVAEPETAVDADDQLAVMDLQVQIEDVLMAHQDVVAVSPAGVSDDGELLAFRVVPVDGPSSVSTEELVGALRGLSPIDSADNGAITLGVAGAASGNIDISATISDALPLYLAIVIGLSLIILVIVFRSILVPLIATGGFLLSLFAALGAVTAIYQWGWLGEIFGVHDPGPVLNFAPIILTGVLFGLAMDYQLFIGSGMREAFVHGAPARVAVTAGVRGARAVVIAAAIIMISVFGGFVFSHLAMVRPLGFGMAVGVLFDAFVVRLLLMPALMHLLGRSAWWLPKWLNRILPDVDVEGASLERPALRPGVHTVPASGRRGGTSAPAHAPARR